MILDASLPCAIGDVFLLLQTARLLVFLPPTQLANKGEPQNMVELDMHRLVQLAEQKFKNVKARRIKESHKDVRDTCL